MGRKVIFIAAIIGAIGIMLGAFGAHGLKKVVTEAQVATFEIGVRYQMYHALFLLFIGICGIFSDKAKKIVMYLVLFGILFFCGSIYLLTFKDMITIDLRVVGPITPVGGVLFIVAWLYAGIQAYKSKNMIK
ncbi:DUF423 domain-containing protein [Myroides odoratimimus]|uniref:DUF423 domain-containing protein n=2 Tax=Myroides odoratimimus TaxID=76832 RepID=A0ABN0E7J2_9FLAO|nr:MULTISPECIES: DUF423 domain-containing protein [Myroides]AJA67996.1 putative small membrane protein [Myroides sp. A21]EHO04799.1 hypothetical protein HMPREF9715_03396 [Myroides odoratimimus CIP 101113]EHO05456.1 hypothetical protein HMPREF9714_03394 [Myroides odoratimimus CCUG 12901]EHO07077.1 hypothetical protein HMPREF9712_02866 [Myroides odoratimimus CCUG 10230]MCA4791675.1 DUF423 domain-containing protein [Myroides odoratimimus]